ncbi:MAG: hypothetical protein HN576_00935 [Bacteriovoracaceae bacterium]|nr:hypothetical protein [Bacteriovoracaceae bacterium]
MKKIIYKKLPLMLLSLTFILLTSNTYALECPSTLTTRDIAKELLRSEFSGLRLESHRKHKCLSQKNFPYNIIESDVSNDENVEIFGLMNSMKDLVILDLVTIDSTTFTYKVKYQVRHNTAKKKKFLNWKKDTMTFFLYKDKKNQSIYGCGGIIESPKEIFMLKACQ